MDTNLFKNHQISAETLATLEELGFQKMTPIQEQSIPALLQGKDLIGQSKTGSGKTLAFALPMIETTELENKNVQHLIICPTRELCAQVAREIRKFAKRKTGLQILIVCGGQPSRPQVQSLENGVHFVVGTPGRLVDLIQKNKLILDNIKTLVLDEADKMLEMGFEDDLRIIMQSAPTKKQTVFFSATFPDSILGLSQKFQNKPLKIEIAQDTAESQNPIEQLTYDVGQESKIHILMRILQQHNPETAIIFCNQKIKVTEIYELIKNEKVSCGALHGDLEQRDRDRVMAMFRNGSLRILVATDVASRGLDIDHLDLVVNYDLPHQPEIYVHRIGRTGRAGKSGVAATLVCNHELIKIQEIERYTQTKMTNRPLGFKNQHGLASLFRTSAMQTLSIGGGRKDKVRPGDILGALTGDAGGFQSSQIGKIEIHEHLCYVAVDSSIAKSALQKLRDGKIKGHKFQVRLITEA